MKPVKTVIISSVFFLSSASILAGSNEAEIEHSKHHPVAVSKVQNKEDTSSKTSMPMMANMQESMQKMQETMQKIHAATTDTERKKLLGEHMKLMSEHMKMMKDMGMGGEGGMSAMYNKDEKQGMGAMEGGMKCSMMDKMDMMQKMMDQMMQHMAAME